MNGIHDQKNISVYETVYAYQYMAGIQKSLKKYDNKNYSLRSAIQKFWYMSGIQAKKSRMKLSTNLFFCRGHHHV